VGFEEQGELSYARLTGSREDLESVADAFYQRIWEAAEDDHKAREGQLTQALVSVSRAIAAPVIREGLSGLHDHLDRIELRLPSDDVIEMNEDLAAKHIDKKDKALVRTWGNKVVRATGNAVVKRALKEGGNEVVELLEGTFEGDED